MRSRVPLALVAGAAVALALGGAGRTATDVLLDVDVIAARGSVLVSPLGQPVCDQDGCVFGYLAGKRVTLTATPGARSRFVGWEGECAGARSTCTLVLDSSMRTTALFTPLQVRLGFSAGGTIELEPEGGACEPDCREFPYGTSVRVTAVPNTDFSFRGWRSGCPPGSTEPTCTIVLRSNVVLSAVFQRGNIIITPAQVGVTLTVGKQGRGRGVVIGGNRSGADLPIRCGDDCTARFSWREEIWLQAKPRSGSGFKRWKGVSCKKAKSCVFNVDQGTVKAVFIRK